MIDAHLHLRDKRIRAVHARFVKEALDAGVEGCISCTASPDEWFVETHCSWEVYNAYGVHPWYVGVLPPGWQERLTACLEANSKALVGEIGLDGIRRVTDGGAQQRQILEAQLALAVRFQRPVVLHGARMWVPLLKLLEPYLTKLPAVLLHGVSFSADLLTMPLFKASNLYFSIGGAICSPTAKTLPALAQALPLDRLLIETDAPDMLPYGGDPLILGQEHSLLNSPANLSHICATLAHLRGLPSAELAAITTANTRAFLK